MRSTVSIAQTNKRINVLHVEMGNSSSWQRPVALVDQIGGCEVVGLFSNIYSEAIGHINRIYSTRFYSRNQEVMSLCPH